MQDPRNQEEIRDLLDSLTDPIRDWNATFRTLAREESDIRIRSSVNTNPIVQNPSIEERNLRETGVFKRAPRMRAIMDDSARERIADPLALDRHATMLLHSTIGRDWMYYRDSCMNVITRERDKLKSWGLDDEYIDSQLSKLDKQKLPYNLAHQSTPKLFSKPPLLEKRSQGLTNLLAANIDAVIDVYPYVVIPKDISDLYSPASLLSSLLNTGDPDSSSESEDITTLGLPLFKQTGLPFVSSARDAIESARAYGLHLSLAKKGIADPKMLLESIKQRESLFGGVLARRDSNAFGKLMPLISFNPQSAEISVIGTTSTMNAPRDVVAMGKFYKAICGPIYSSFIGAMQLNKWTDLQFDSILSRLGSHTWNMSATDFSSYDKTEGEKLLHAAIDVMFKNHPMAGEFAKQEVSARTLFKVAGKVISLPFLGANSGNSGITATNTLINGYVARTAYAIGQGYLTYDELIDAGQKSKVVDALRKVRQSEEQGELIFLLLGDDAVVISRSSKFDRDNHIAILEQMGWQVKIEPNSFLKRSLFMRNGRWYAAPQFYTFLSNRYASEKSKTDRVPVILGTASLLMNFATSGIDSSTLASIAQPAIVLLNDRLKQKFKDIHHVASYAASQEFLVEILAYSNKLEKMQTFYDLLRGMTLGTFDLRLTAGPDDAVAKNLSKAIKMMKTPNSEEMIAKITTTTHENQAITKARNARELTSVIHNLHHLSN